MKAFRENTIRKWLRIIHRDLGYFTVGMTIVYAVSGIILNHKKINQDPAYKTLTFEYPIEPSLTPDGLKDFFSANFLQHELRSIIPGDTNYQLFLKGGTGFYVPETGQLSFEIYKRKPLVFFMNKLHYNQKKLWTFPADFYAASLLFFALSGLFMVRGKKGLPGRGKWLVAGGIAVIVLYLLI